MFKLLDEIKQWFKPAEADSKRVSVDTGRVISNNIQDATQFDSASLECVCGCNL